MLARSALSVPASRTWDSPAKLASSTSPAKPLSQSEGPASVSVTTKARRVPVSEAEISGVPVNITVFAQTTSTSSSVAPPATRLRYPASTSAVAPALSAQTTSQASAPARLTRSRLPTPPSGEREPAAVVTSQQVDPLASPMKVARRAALAGATPARTGSKATDSQGSSVDVNDVFNHPSAAGKSLRPRGAKTALPSALPVPASTQQAGPYAAPKGEPQDSGSVTTSASASTSASGGRKPRTSRAAKGTLFGAPTTAAGERLPPLPISAAELSRLTARHTRRNEVYLAKLDMHTIRVNGPRPPSPTSKVKKAIGARLNKSEAALRVLRAQSEESSEVTVVQRTSRT